MPSIVYVVGPIEGCYKIGRTKYLPVRLRQLNTLPVSLGVTAAIATTNAPWLEKYLHLAFHQVRVRREWFRLAPEDLELVTKLTTVNAESDFPAEITSLYAANRARRIGKGASGQDKRAIGVHVPLLRKVLLICAHRRKNAAEVFDMLAGPAIDAEFRKVLDELKDATDKAAIDFDEDD